jgi:hypothetical protein
MSRRDPRILFLIKALIAMIFLSKISLGAFLPLPNSFGFLIFQKGMHPYLNVLLCFLLGLPLGLLFLKVRDRKSLSGFYKLFVLGLMAILSVQTLLQVSHTNESLVMSLGALGSSLFMVLIYGWIIPSLWTAEEFVRFVQKWTGLLVIISIALWPLFGGVFFKGGRFVGVFKHIPYMVTCSTVAFIFSLGTLILARSQTEKIWSTLVLLTGFLGIVLTGTRSSVAAAVFGLLLITVLHKARTNTGRLVKFSGVMFLLLYALFFGMQTIDFARQVATGQASLGNREAQDGVSSRWEEIERGYEIFQQAPWTGHGLLSKFAAGGDVDVSNYNSMKDPHNIFVSAGVIGGWPLLVMSGISLILMIIGCLKSLQSRDLAKRQLAIYLLSHIPILAIYHIHLSLGGMADRMYWLVFGFVAASAAVSAQEGRPETAP